MKDNIDTISLHDWYCSLRWGINASICPNCQSYNMENDMEGIKVSCHNCKKKYTIFYDTVINTPYRTLEQVDSLLELLCAENVCIYRKQIKQLDWTLIVQIVEIVLKKPTVIHTILKKSDKGYRSFYVKYIPSLNMSKQDLFYALLYSRQTEFSEPVEIREYDQSVINDWSNDQEALEASIEYFLSIETDTDELLSDEDTSKIVNAIHEGISVERSNIDDETIRLLHSERKQLAEEILIERNQGLLYKIAYEIYSQNKYTTIDDCMQECAIALLDVIQYFNPNLGYKLSTYIIYPIKHRVVMSLGKQDRPIYLPARKRKEISEYMIKEKELISQTGTKPTENEMTIAMLGENYTQAEYKQQKEKVLEIKKALLLNPLSLDMYNEDDDEQSMYDFTLIDDDQNVEESIDHLSFKDNVSSIIDESLPWPDNKILKMYYGIGNDGYYNAKEIADILNKDPETLNKRSKPYTANAVVSIVTKSKDVLRFSDLQNYLD